jgi:hypothetical protein
MLPLKKQEHTQVAWSGVLLQPALIGSLLAIGWESLNAWAATG